MGMARKSVAEEAELLIFSDSCSAIELMEQNIIIMTMRLIIMTL